MSHVSSLQALVFGVNITVAISGDLCISCACSLDVAAACADSTKKSEGRERAMSSAFGKRSLTNSVSMIGDSLHLTSVKLYCQRLAKYKGTGRSDPTLDRRHLRNLTRSCQWNSNLVNLGKKMGLLPTDQELYSDPGTAPFVSAFTNQQPDLSLTSLQCQW
ncbi:hypothetical protein NC651_020063 [Populus alba x Populus x berolinensis]|nr:hypothetical protein NC651_020063 [Populus alba x Populus x berolinensis]